MKLETRAVHAGPPVYPDSGDIVPPIHVSTTFGRDAASELISDHFYIRYSNPNQVYLEEAMAELEGGEGALAFSSGMGAAAALLQSLEPGNHVLISDDVYFGVRRAAEDYCAKWGIEVDFIAMEDPANVQAGVRPKTKIVWMETPSNPLMKIVDIRKTAEATHSVGAQLLIDNTFATPILQRPIEYGADIVLHSATKYIGGHSDVAGGCLVFKKKERLWETVERTRHTLGAILSPFNSWLALRGLRTLACRMEVQCRNAMRVSEMLGAHPRIDVVHYPGLESHPGHRTAAAQMSLFGAMVSFQLSGDRAAALGVVGRANLLVRATSLGGVESLIEHRATSEGPRSTTPDNLIRLSIGLEHPEDLIDDLTNALCPV